MINMIWVSDHPAGKQKLKDLKHHSSDDLLVYEVEEKISDIVRLIEWEEKTGATFQIKEDVDQRFA